MPQRQIEHLCRLPLACRGGEPVEKQREACRRLVTALDHIGSAAPDRAAHSIGIKREAEPALILEAVAFGRIERDPRTFADAPRDFLDPADPAGERPARIDRAQLVERLRDRTCSIEQRQISLTTRPLQPAPILGIARPPPPFAPPVNKPLERKSAVEGT